MNKLSLILALFGLIWAGQVSAQETTGGEGLFKQKCSICHTIGKGKLIGPDLANVHQRREESWLLNFIRSSQKMIQSGDADAVALYEEHNKVIMPDHPISDVEIKSIVSYIAETSGVGPGAQAYVSIIGDATPEDLENGRRLFDGRVGFANKGASCNSCHNGLAKTFFNENSYAKDLSSSFSTLGEAGVKAILENPPFPVMAGAFVAKKLEPDEIHDLLVFLNDADTGSASQANKPISSGFLLYGVMGASALLVLYSGFWYGRKDRSVNHSIYKRQIKSTN